MPNILYYSAKCKKCLEICRQLKHTQLLGEFDKKLCIDKALENKRFDLLPGFLKTVPMILVDDYEKPLDYGMIKNWIEYKVKKRAMGQDKPKQQPQAQQQQAPKGDMGGIMPYGNTAFDGCEMLNGGADIQLNGHDNYVPIAQDGSFGSYDGTLQIPKTDKRLGGNVQDRLKQMEMERGI